MITAHVLVKNEYKYIWYSVMSVLPHVDKMILWDTGSTDGTQEIIKEIQQTKSAQGKLSVEIHNEPFDEEKIRQGMLEKTDSGWFIVVDGDEIWWDSSISLVCKTIREKGNTIESIVVPTINVVGDIFHYQEEKAGNYHLAGKVGHYAIRAINTSIPGLHSFGRHGIWGWVDGDNNPIQNRAADKIVFLNAPYLHMTYLPRASSRLKDTLVEKRSFKRKYEIGIEFPSDYYYPEIFFRPRPPIIQSIWQKAPLSFKARASIETPLRKVKRRVFPKKVGY